MERILVWDVPTRLFHWLLVAGLVAAFVMAETSDEESGAFAIHMAIGLVVGLMVVLRIVWGFVGSRWARFGAFSLGLGALVGHLRAAFGRKPSPVTGHNPASSWVAVVMLVGSLGLAVTGILMTSGHHGLKEAHELFVLVMVLSTIAHLLGIVLHTIRHRDGVALGMFGGKKLGEPSEAIRSAHPVAGIAFLAITGAGTALLLAGFDATSGEITVPGLGWTLGGEEEEDEGEHGGRHEDEDEHGGRHEDEDEHGGRHEDE